MNKNNNRFYVYEHWRSDTGLPFYVGKGTGARANDLHYNRNRYYRAVVDKLNRLGNFVEVVMVHKDLTEDAAFFEEEIRIDFLRGQGIKLTNLAKGGAGGHAGCRHSDEWKRRLSERMTVVMSDPERRRKQGDRRRGVKLTQEQRLKYSGPKSHEHVEAMKRAAKGRKRPPPRSASHIQKQKSSLAEWRATEEFKKHWDVRRERAAQNRFKKEEVKRLDRKRKEDAAIELRTAQLVRSIAAGTAKNCSCCGELKPPEIFTKHKAGKNGLGSYCKRCANIKQREFQNTRRAKEALEIEE